MRGFSPMTNMTLTFSPAPLTFSVRVRPGSVGHLCAPRLTESLPRLGVGHPLVPGEEVGEGADVAGALDVVLAAEWVYAGAGSTDVPGEHGEVRGAEDVVDPGDVLGDAHAEEDRCPLGGAVDARSFPDLLGGDPGYALGVLRRVLLHVFPEGLVALGPRSR